MREDFSFDSQGTRCAAWLYRPASAGRQPCLVMGHGFSAVREQRLDAYAGRFAQAGLVVLLFDYRHFGASGGEPRQLLSIRRQLQDWEAAIAAARTLPDVDPERVAIFGTSFGGGHVQRIAARDATLAAAIAQVPFCDGLKNLPALGMDHVMRLTVAGLRDVGGALFGRPYKIPAAGMPGSVAAMTTPDVMPGFANMNPPGSSWRNEVFARIALAVGSYRPGVGAGRIRCPILYSIADQDLLTPPGLAYAAAKRAPRAEAKGYPCGHFDVYMPPMWDKVVGDQVEFLVRHLKPR